MEDKMTTPKEYGPGIFIHSDIAVPKKPNTHSYPFKLLEVGQCFMLDFEDRKHLASIRSSATAWTRKYRDEGRQYVVRRIPDTTSQVGVWRTS